MEGLYVITWFIIWMLISQSWRLPILYIYIYCVTDYIFAFVNYLNYLLKGEGLHYLTLFELFMWVEGLHYLILFELFMCQANLMYNCHCGENVWTLILGNDIIRLSQFKVYWLSMLVKFCLTYQKLFFVLYARCIWLIMLKCLKIKE